MSRTGKETSLVLNLRNRRGIIFLAALCLLGFPLSARADEPAKPLEQLRQAYQQARDTLAKTENPDFGDPGFREKLSSWSKAYRTSNESAQALIAGLLNRWITLPKGSAEAEPARKEIKQVFKELAGKPRSEQYHQAKSFMARTTWPLLAGNTLSPERAALLVELNEPQALVRKADNMAKKGQRYESIGWDSQAAYALALIRSGEDQKASEEITLLHRKVSMQHAFNPKGRLDFGPEAGEGRHRSYIDVLQVCEVLHGLQAALSDDRKGAMDRMAHARKLREALSPEAKLLAAEINRLAGE